MEFELITYCVGCKDVIESFLNGKTFLLTFSSHKYKLLVRYIKNTSADIEDKLNKRQFS